MLYFQIVLNIPLNQTFTYSYKPEIEDEELTPESFIGKRAEITFGNRKTQGFIVKASTQIPADCPVDSTKIKLIKRIIDKESLFGKELTDLAAWMSHYYLCSFGEAVFTMVPSGRRETGLGGFAFEDDFSVEKHNILSDEQQKAVDSIYEMTKKSSEEKEQNRKASLTNNHYIYGPTGTGKTEVFLSLAEKILSDGKGVIYLVPEIGLTAQVVKDATKRFGKTAAILHSGLTPSQRLGEWNRIMHKEARIVIGARSAVFAPVPELGLIIIDEEHDNSYKSGNSPRYNARQIAMHRCNNLKIPLVMGSATPSVEAWYSMQQNKIITHKLTKRLAGGTMPKISTIDLKYFPNDCCISPPLQKEISECIKNKRQTILFLNRRGFTHFFRCNSCGFEIVCKNCSVPLTYHKSEHRLRCHYCGWSTLPPQSCPECSSMDIGSTGFGTEFIEAEVKAKFPQAKIIRADTDAFKNKEEFLKVLDDFRDGKYDIMLGTQMVAKGLNFPKLQLVGVILADAGLHMPDFRASERTFSLITQVAGRAGRYFPDGKVVVQTYEPSRKAILYACNGKVEEFYENELKERELLDFPPFSRLLRFVFRSYNKEAAFRTSIDAANIISQKKLKGIEIIGPAECPIEKMNSSWRFQILLKSKSISVLQEAARHLLFDYSHNPNVYIEYDCDPVSLL